MSEQSIKPYQQGYNAGILGKSPLSCPYKSHTNEWKQWLTGHKRGNDLVWFLSAEPPVNKIEKRVGRPLKPGGKYA